MACGFEPPVAAGFAWRHRGMDLGDIDKETGKSEREPRVCPGYTTKLPEVVEAANAYFDRKELHVQNKLRQSAMMAMKVIASEAITMQSWAMRNPRKEG